MRLLILEDEADLLRALAKVLRRVGYAVDTAADGAEGLRKAREHDYDAVLLEAMMPVLGRLGRVALLETLNLV